MLTCVESVRLRALDDTLGKGENAPVTPDQLKTALGPAQVKALTEEFGASEDDVLKLLAKQLPGVVDKASPEGTLPSTAV